MATGAMDLRIVAVAFGIPLSIPDQEVGHVSKLSWREIAKP